MELGQFSPMLSWSEVVGMGVGKELASLYWTIKYLNVVLDVKLKIYELKNQYLIFQQLRWQNFRMKTGVTSNLNQVS